MRISDWSSDVCSSDLEAGDLSIGYVDTGPADGRVAILLHGWPYDIHSYADVAPLLAEAGWRVIVPFLRGYGTTHFLSDEMHRNGQQAALAADVIALLNAPKIETAGRGGCDRGARPACTVAELWPAGRTALGPVT